MNKLFEQHLDAIKAKYGQLIVRKNEPVFERVGDVSNVLFTNGWIADDDGTTYLYYASCDTRMHVAVSSVERLLDYCLNTSPDGYRSATSV